MKIFQNHRKYFCKIEIGDTLYVVHDNDIIEKLTVTKDHKQANFDMKPTKEVFKNLYLANNNFEINYDGRLVLNTLTYITSYSHSENTTITELNTGYELANVFIDEEKAKQYIKDRKGRKHIQEFHKQFADYPKILVYNTKNDEVLGDVSTTNPLECLHELFILTDNLKEKGFAVDIAVFDDKKYKIIKDLEILDLIRELIK